MKRLSLILSSIIGLGMASFSTAAVAAPTPTVGSTYTQSVNIYYGSKKSGMKHGQKHFLIPGIGSGTIACQPNVTWIQMAPSSRTNEATMWAVVNETKNGVLSQAVKTARVYTYSTPTSTIPHGTGATAYEGFNQDTPIEDESSGSMIGLISSRGPLNQPTSYSPPTTAFQLSWSWNNFHYNNATCKVTATFTTQVNGIKSASLPSSYFNFNWNGEQDIPNALARSTSMIVPGIGPLSATCPSGIESNPQATIALEDASEAPYVATTLYQGEGTESALNGDYYSDPTTNTMTPIPLPVNGFLVGYVYPSLVSTTPVSMFYITSYLKTNDPDPAMNYCQLAGDANTLN